MRVVRSARSARRPDRVCGIGVLVHVDLKEYTIEELLHAECCATSRLSCRSLEVRDVFL